MTLLRLPSGFFATTTSRVLSRESTISTEVDFLLIEVIDNPNFECWRAQCRAAAESKRKLLDGCTNLVKPKEIHFIIKLVAT